MVPPHLCRLVVPVLAAIAVAACDSNGSVRLMSAPSAFTGSGFGAPAPFAGVSVAPSIVPIVRVPHARCPDVSPFGSSFVLIVTQNGAPDAFLVQADFQFFDSTGLVSSAIFAQTDLSAMFGTTLISARTTRHFEFAPTFGCGLAFVPHSLSGRLLLRDARGLRHERTITARVG